MRRALGANSRSLPEGGVDAMSAPPPETIQATPGKPGPTPWWLLLILAFAVGFLVYVVATVNFIWPLTGAKPWPKIENLFMAGVLLVLFGLLMVSFLLKARNQRRQHQRWKALQVGRR